MLEIMYAARSKSHSNAAGLTFLFLFVANCLCGPRPLLGSDASLILRALPEKSVINTAEPLLVRVTLINVADLPVEVVVHDGGAPVRISTLISYEGGEYFEQDQHLDRNRSELRRKVINSGESTEGETVIIFKKNPPGLAFSQLGSYRLRLRYSHSGSATAAETDPFEITVTGRNRDAEEFVRALREPAIAYGGVTPRALDALLDQGTGPEYDLLLDIMLMKGLRRHGEAEDAQKAELELLIGKLRKLCEDYPGSPISGYAERFIGLYYA